MPKTRLRVPIVEVGSGGVNEDEAPGSLQPNELRVGRNVYLRGRALSSRRGTSAALGTLVNNGTSIFEYVRNSGVDRLILATAGAVIYRDAITTPVNITGTATVTAGQNNLVGWMHVNNLAVGYNGVDTPWKVDGTANAAVLGGSPPTFGAMVTKWNRTLGAGHSAAIRTIRFSALGDPESWPAANTVPAVLGDASAAIEGRDFIYALGHLGDSVFVGLENSVGRVLYTGDALTPFRYTQVADFGCEGRFSYVAVGNDGYFLSKRGVHFIRTSDVQMSYESSLVGGKRLRTTWDALNKSRIRYTYGTLYRTVAGNLLVLWPLTAGSGTTHDTILVMDVTEGPGTERFFWWTFGSLRPNAMCAAVNSSTYAERLLFVTAAGVTHELDTGTDDNTAAYVAEAATRWEDFGAPAEKKNFRDLYIEASQSGSFNLTIETYFDYATTASQRVSQSLAGAVQAAWNTAVWNTAVWPTLGFIRAYNLGVDDGVVMSIRLLTTGANQPWSVYKLVPAIKSAGEAIES